MDELISREKAIEALQEHRNLFCDNTPETFSGLPYSDKCRVDEIDNAIATLINLPSAQLKSANELAEKVQNAPNDDFISRKATIDAVKWGIIYADEINTNTGEVKELCKEGNDALKKAVERIKDLPSAQPETHEERTETHACDCIERQAAMEEISKQQTYKMFEGEDTVYLDANDVGSVIASLPSAQPEHTNSCYTNSWCINCKEYDKEKHSCPRFNRVIKQTLDEVYAHAETEAEARYHAQIVRCKDCVYAADDDYHHCSYVTWWNGENDFCSKGKRRTDE